MRNPLRHFYLFSIIVIVVANQPKIYKQFHRTISASTVKKGSQLVGKSCTFSSECTTGAFCERRICQCFSTHVNIDDYCWKKINPTESGCTSHSQCSAVWPNALCSSEGICECGEGEEAVETQEGTVCHIRGYCPLNSLNGVLLVPNTNRQSECYFFDKTENRPENFVGCEDSPELYDCIDGLCCPSRAFTCIQPVDYGVKTNENSTSRWYYNSASGNCRSFEYLGKGGNSNNFLNRDQCISYCKNRCLRGKTFKCSDECADKYKCETIEENSMCCPTSEYICSEYGGIGSRLQTPYHSGSHSLGKEPTERWFYDKERRQCRTFQYGGYGGNFNNFLTETECSDFCSRSLCSIGSPLKVDVGSNAECESDHQCPQSHFCTQTVCCPKKVTVCNLPLAVGVQCHTEPITRFWFNSTENRCHQFEFRGCEGNANNFPSLAECQKVCDFADEEPSCPHGEPLKMESGEFWKCDHEKSEGGDILTECPRHFECHFDGKTSGCCPKKEYTCRLSADSGRRCDHSAATRWYFDSHSRLCRSFEFNGCGGNSNSFESERLCEDYCGTGGCPFGGKVLLNGTEPTVCGDSTKCPQTHLCTQMSQNSSHHCCPTRLTICSMELSEGENCAEPTVRFAFDSANHLCKPFLYRGCGGNENNFQTLASCQNLCSASACAVGELTYKERNSEQPFDCSRQQCPDGFICVADVNRSQQSICCGTMNMGVCPNGQSALLNDRSQKPQSCSAKANECPFGYFCVFNSERSKFFCCSPNNYADLKCPNGLEATRNPKSNELMGCSTDQQCPPGSKCHRSIGENFSGLCCMSGPICPPTYIFDAEQSKKVCDPVKSPTCGDGLTVCLLSEPMNRFVCCRRMTKPHTELTDCPGVMVRDPSKRVCSISELCPPLYNCIRRNYERNGICCRHRRSPQTVGYSLECPNGGLPLKDSTGLIQICNDRVFCPHPFKCRLSETAGSRSRICCKEAISATTTPPPARCPHDLLPLSSDGRQQNCSQASCPAGYRCHENACCPNEEFSCSVPFYSGVRCGSAKPSQRWYFHSSTGRCQSFIYHGCTPSANNFPDQRTCHRLCVEREAATDRQCSFPYRNPIEGNPPRECADGVESQCNDGERCIMNRNGHLLCCVLETMVPEIVTDIVESEERHSVCGPNYEPILDNGKPHNCHPFHQKCPNGQICQYAATFGEYVCCLESSRRSG